MNGTQWVYPGTGATVRELALACKQGDVALAVRLDAKTDLALTGETLDARDLTRIMNAIERVRLEER